MRCSTGELATLMTSCVLYSCHATSIDLDIEGGDTSHYDVFVKKLRTYFDGAPKK